MSRETDLESALKASNDALVELMACSTDMLNSRIGKNLYQQCHAAVMQAAPLVRANQQNNLAAQKMIYSPRGNWPL